jgi:hypothetical protein
MIASVSGFVKSGIIEPDMKVETAPKAACKPPTFAIKAGRAAVKPAIAP